MSLTFLDKIISNDAMVDDKQPVLGDDPLEDTTNQISVFAAKIELLKKIYNSHQLLTADIEAADSQFSTLILEINDMESYLVLDEFYPSPGSQAVTTNRKVKFYTYLSGVQIDFASTIEAVSEDVGNPYYKVPIPDKIYYYQNRQYLRVPISAGNPIKIVLSDNKSVITNAEIRDLSAGGFSARLKLMQQRFSIGEVIPNCIIYMPGDRKIYCSIEIRQSVRATATASPKIGVRFLEIRKNDQKIIEKHVAEIDRDLTRRFRK